jgi:hypothetical protein
LKKIPGEEFRGMSSWKQQRPWGEGRIRRASKAGKD